MRVPHWNSVFRCLFGGFPPNDWRFTALRGVSVEDSLRLTHHVVIRVPISSLEVFKDKFLHLSPFLISYVFDFCLVRSCLSLFSLLCVNLCASSSNNFFFLKIDSKIFFLNGLESISSLYRFLFCYLMHVTVRFYFQFDYLALMF